MLEKYKEYLQKKKITYKRLAKGMGYNSAYICKVLNGTYHMNNRFMTLFHEQLKEIARKDLDDLNDLLKELEPKD